MKAALATLASTLYLGWTTYNGAPVRDSIATLSVLAFQSLVGLVIVRRLVQVKLAALETIAVAFAIGSLSSTLVDQLSLNIGINTPAWVGQTVLALAVTALARKTSGPIVPTPLIFDFRLLAATPLVVMTGYGVFTRGWWLAISLLCVTNGLNFFKQISKSTTTTILSSFIGSALWLVTLFMARPSTPKYGDLMLRPLYTGSDDFVFSESMSWSLAHFGIGDYAAAIGTSVRYHWFSLAWSGLIDKLSGATPFVTTLHVVPTVTFAMIAWLIFALISATGLRRIAGAIGVAVLFGTATVIDPIRFYHVLNTSNVAPYIWMLLVPILLVSLAQRSLGGATFTIPVLIAVAFLAKAPFGVAVLVGTVSTLLVMWWRNRTVRGFVLPAVVAITSAATYFVFLSPHSWEQREYAVSWNLANLAPDSRLYPLIPISLILVILATMFVGFIGLGRQSQSNAETLLVTFLVTTAAVGSLRFVLSGGSAELYFFNVTTLCAALVTGIGFASAIEKLSKLPKVLSIAAGALGFIGMNIEIDHGVLSRVIPRQASLIILPIALGLFLAVSLVGTSRVLSRSSKPPFKPLLIITTVAASSAILVNVLKQPEEYVSTTQVASIEDVSALSWLRVSSPESAIVATNRFLCASTEPCSFDDSSFLISAVARRRVLVEGPRFVIGGRPYPQWMTDRIALSTRFAERPNDDDLRALKEYGVSWFVVSERFLPTGTLVESDWAKFGIIRYRQDGVAIIELRS